MSSPKPITLFLDDIHEIRAIEGTPRLVSAIDVIHHTTGKSSPHSSEVVGHLKNRYQHVFDVIQYYKFPGQGQRPTPVVDARGLWLIMSMMPHWATEKFRDMNGHELVRRMGGNEKLVETIRTYKPDGIFVAAPVVDAPVVARAPVIVAEPVKEPIASEDPAKAPEKAEFEDNLERRKMELELEEKRLLNAERSFKIKRDEYEFLTNLSRMYNPSDEIQAHLESAKRACILRNFA